MKKETHERARENVLHEMGDLMIDQDLGHHRRRWVFQRCGFVAMALFIGAGASGLLGSGPLSDRTLNAADSSFALEYRRYEHADSETALRLVLGSAERDSGKIAVHVSRAYLDSVKLVRVNPQPEAVEIGSERFTYRFAQASLAPGATIAFEIEMRKAGTVEGRIGLENGESVAFSHFVYP